MSITSDIRTYADTAVAEGRKVLDTTLATAQAQLQNVSSAAEPYLAQVKDYQATAKERADGIYTSLKKDERLGRVIDTAETVTEVVVGTVQERVVKPVLSFTGRGSAAKPAPARATKPAATRPANSKPAAKKATARPAAKKTTTQSTGTSGTTNS